MRKTFFIILIGVSTLAMSQVETSNDIQPIIRQLSEQLDLSREQKAQLKTILEVRANTINELRNSSFSNRKKKDGAIAANNLGRNDFRKLLNEEQLDIYDSIISELAEQRDAANVRIRTFEELTQEF